MSKKVMNTEDKRSWRVVEFALPGAQEDMASWLMMQLGANGCEIDDTADGGSENIILRATFESDRFASDTTPLLAAMEEYGLSTSIPTLRISTLEEEDWLAKWKTGFTPFPVGERLLVCPEWERDNLTAEQTSGRKVIYIEPGLAFGTGFHPTTRFCLSSVEKRISHSRRVLDVGTGSGILAIGAALLSSPDVVIVALETDPLACKVARENFELNGVNDRVELHEGSTEQLLGSSSGPSAKSNAVGAGAQFDFVLSNLTYEDNSALLADYLELTTPDAYFAFAGILREKLDLMRSALAKHGFSIVEEELGDMWAGLLARR